MNDTAPRVAIFTLTMDRLAYTQRMLASLSKSTFVPYDHYIIDDGSVDGTRGYLEAHGGDFAAVVLNAENKGIGPSWNQALDLIGDDYDYIVKVDNDCEFTTPGWLEALIEVCRACDNRIVLSPAVGGLRGPSAGYPRYESTVIADHEIGLARHVGGLCLLAPIEACVGFRFPRAAKRGHQDVTFSMHARLVRGYDMGYVEDIWVQHIDTTVGQRSRYPDYHSKRVLQEREVWGEPSIITKLLHPVRRVQYIRRRRAAGLSEETLLSAVRSKAARALARVLRGRESV